MITNRFSVEYSDDVMGDILEFQALVAGATGIDLLDIQRQIDIESRDNVDDSSDVLPSVDFGDENNEDTDEAEADFLRVVGVLEERARRTGEEHYPFELSQDGSSFKLKESLTDSSTVYLFCLLLSHPKADDVLNGLYAPEVRDSERRLFQSCSTVAAAGLVSGNSVSFGFPRHDGSGFLRKLREVFALIGDGRVRTDAELLPATNASEVKDFEIDVIAWLTRADASALERYFLGQVASGMNWGAKPLSDTTIAEFHTLWFSTKPMKSYERGFFTPVLLPTQPGATLDESLQVYQLRFGEFHYRFSIPRHFHRGQSLANGNTPSSHVEGLSDFSLISSWVDNQLAKIRSLVAAS